jgi:hypothetical protein
MFPQTGHAEVLVLLERSVVEEARQGRYETW